MIGKSRPSRSLSFLASQRSPGNAQLMLLDRRGGEATALTDPNDDIAEYSWSLDGQHVALVTHRSDGEPPKQTNRPIVIDALHFEEGCNSEPRPTPPASTAAAAAPLSL
jgi:dipeptidyl aminopeptidase/acylaminoacyl peptidase